MKRRGFLQFLGLSPAVVPAAVKGMEAFNEKAKRLDVGPPPPLPKEPTERVAQRLEREFVPQRWYSVTASTCCSLATSTAGLTRVRRGPQP